MSATVDIQTKQVSDVLSVPIQAVTTREPSAGPARDGEESPEGDDADAGLEADRAEQSVGSEASADSSLQTADASRPQEYVFVYRDGKAVQMAVTSGVQDSQYIEILEGLEEGDEVITGPYRVVSRNLQDGDHVEKVNRQDLF
jgi:HlyD family secretion protein